MACGAEMVLMNAVRDDTMAVAGFEHHTLQCSSCNDIERRLVFNPENATKPEAVATEPVEVAPPVSPTVPADSDEPAVVTSAEPSEETGEPASAPAPAVSAWRRAVAMFRGRHAG
jgi:hypothetical protein